VRRPHIPLCLRIFRSITQATLHIHIHLGHSLALIDMMLPSDIIASQTPRRSMVATPFFIT
jgi:hypothetical protein